MQVLSALSLEGSHSLSKQPILVSLPERVLENSSQIVLFSPPPFAWNRQRWRVDKSSGHLGKQKWKQRLWQLPVMTLLNTIKSSRHSPRGPQVVQKARSEVKLDPKWSEHPKTKLNWLRRTVLLSRLQIRIAGWLVLSTKNLQRNKESLEDE